MKQAGKTPPAPISVPLESGCKEFAFGMKAVETAHGRTRGMEKGVYGVGPLFKHIMVKHDLCRRRSSQPIFNFILIECLRRVCKKWR
jgi:hypothetical protein